jgi:hypothetical protein
MGYNDHLDDRAKKRAVKRERNFPPPDKVVVSELDIHAALDLLDACLEFGNAVRIGFTRDKSVWAIGIYAEGDRHQTEYIKPGEDVNQYFHDLAAWMRNGSQGG